MVPHLGRVFLFFFFFQSLYVSMDDEREEELLAEMRRNEYLQERRRYQLRIERLEESGENCRIWSRPSRYTSPDL